MPTLIESLAKLPETERTKFLGSLNDEQAATLYYDWKAWARSAQLPPPEFERGEKQIWLLKAGRGFGKTRAGAEWSRARVEFSKNKRGAIIGPTAGDVRDICIEGESGILAVSPPWFRPKYEPSKRRLTWPNGAIATAYSADEPERLRGPQHEWVWAEEIAVWRYGQEAWDNMLLGLRLGKNPQVCATTTAKRTKLYKTLLSDSTCITTGGSTYENAANLPKVFIERIIKRYEGTTLGRQELHSELIGEVEGALWKHEHIEQHRVRQAPALVRIVVAIDPATTSGEEADDTGIVTAGIDENGHGYVLDDSTLNVRPEQWAQKSIELYKNFKADRIIGEANNGGDLIETVIRTVDANVSYSKVHASRGKITRAEPIAALYEQGKVHHVGTLAMLEEEMTTWTLGQKSPNRMDALVWALTELMLGEEFSVLFEA